jgi:hypothetical protein
MRLPTQTILQRILILALTLSACSGGPDSKSPFPLWDMKAGMPFSALDSIALHDQRERFNCRDSHGTYRDCSLRSLGAFGLIQAIVDSTGRAVLISWRPDVDNIMSFPDMMAGLQVESRRMRAIWNTVVMAKPDAAYPPPERGEAWRSDDGKWGAYLIWSKNGFAREFRVTDESAMARWNVLAAAAVADSLAKLAAAPVQSMPEQGDPARLVEMLQFELKRLVDAQVVYHDTRRDYADNVQQLNFSTRPKVVLTIDRATPFGFAARASHPSLAERVCAVWIGERPAANVFGEREREPYCGE